MQTILLGDVLDQLRTLPDNSVQCCVTSPPYWGLRDYGHDGQIGLEKTPEAYVARMVEVFREVRRVLREDGTLWLNLGDSYASYRDGKATPDTTRGDDTGTLVPKGQAKNRMASTFAGSAIKHKDLIGIPWRVAFALQADGWWLRQDIIWNKTSCMPESVKDRCTKSHEYLFLLTKSPCYYFDAEAIKTPVKKDWGTRDRSDGKYHNEGSGLQPHSGLTKSYATANKRSVWTISPSNFKGAHFATFPEALVEPCVLAGTSERGACPQCGTPWFKDYEAVGVQNAWRPACDCPGPNKMYWCWDCDITAHIDELSSGCPQCGETMVSQPPSPIPCVVLDPFLGSGTTLAVAKRLGRQGIGIELNPEYAKIAESRIDSIPTPLI